MLLVYYFPFHTTGNTNEAHSSMLNMSYWPWVWFYVYCMRTMISVINWNPTVPPAFLSSFKSSEWMRDTSTFTECNFERSWKLCLSFMLTQCWISPGQKVCPKSRQKKTLTIMVRIIKMFCTLFINLKKLCFKDWRQRKAGVKRNTGNVQASFGLNTKGPQLGENSSSISSHIHKCTCCTCTLHQSTSV